MFKTLLLINVLDLQMLYQTTIPTAESNAESEDELNARGSVDSKSHETIPEELVSRKPGVDPKSMEA